MAPRLGRSQEKRKSLDMLAGTVLFRTSLSKQVVVARRVCKMRKARIVGLASTEIMFQV